MDARKIQFLIGIQREIDKLEAKDGNTPKVEKVKSRFYDVVEVADLTLTEGEQVKIDEELRNKYDQLLTDFTNTKFVSDEIRSFSEETTNIKLTVHSPRETAKLLKSFKYDSGNSFKYLVHSPNDPSDFDFSKTYTEAKAYWDTYSKEKFLHKGLVNRINTLFDVLGTTGLQFWNNNRVHPLYEDNDVTSAIQKFKRCYRFADEETEGSVLSKYIQAISSNTIFNKKADLENGQLNFFEEFGREAIVYLPSEEKFNIKANFFADVYSFGNGLRTQFQSMIKHSKSSNKEKFISKNKYIPIKLQIEKLNEGYKYDIIICDLGSSTFKEPEDLLKELQEEAKSFYSVCDWSVISKCAGKSYKLVIQPFLQASESINLVEDSACQGFTHIFTFYDL